MKIEYAIWTAGLMLASTIASASAHRERLPVGPAIVGEGESNLCWVNDQWVSCAITLNGLAADDLGKSAIRLPSGQDSGQQVCQVQGEVTICKISLNGLAADDLGKNAIRLPSGQDSGQQVCQVEGEVTICKISLNGLAAEDLLETNLHIAMQ